MADQNIEKGDQVSWQWSGGRPGGEVAEIAEEGEIAIQSKKGNTIKKKASPEDPAVHISRPGNDVVKRAHELDIDEKANGGDTETKENGESNDENKDTEKEEENLEANGKAEADDKAEGEEENQGAKTGDKREHDATDSKKDSVAEANGDSRDSDEAEEKDDEPATKKQKTGSKAAEDTHRKSRGRPPKGEKKQKPKKAPKKAATATGEPRRSGRNKA